VAYTPPSVAVFRARYPEFAAVPDATVEAVLTDAIAEVGTLWIEDDRKPAQLALTAHWLVGQGVLGGIVAAGGGAVQTAGPVASVKVGDVETTFAKASGGSSGGSSGSLSDYLTTSYGQRFLALLRRSFPPVAIV
jgi:hypothetical protein